MTGDGWDRYGAFYERRKMGQALADEAHVRARPRWKKALGWLFGMACATGFWWFFVWAGTRLWKP